MKFKLEHGAQYYDVRPTGDVPDCVQSPTVMLIPKGWGRKVDGLGEYFAYNAPQERKDRVLLVETVKILFFNKNKKLSRHFHVKKKEYFVLLTGSLKVEIWERDSKKSEFIMEPLQRIFIEPGIQHRMTGLSEESMLLEVSTLDEAYDSYRIEKGD